METETAGSPGELDDRGEAAAFARLYDLDLDDDPGDLDMYSALAERADAPILELAVGTGRVAVPLAHGGRRVTGVDIDQAMLDRAALRAAATGRRATANLRLLRADLASGELDDVLRGTPAFGLSILALNSLLLLQDRATQAAALRALAAHLAPGGLAVVDVWLPDAEDLARYDGRLILEYTRREHGTGRWVTKTGSALHDAATATISLTTIYEESEQGVSPVRWIRRDRLRLVGADELRHMAEEAGLVVEVVAGGYELDPLRPGDDRAVLVARRPVAGGRPRTAPGTRRQVRPGVRPGTAGGLV